MIERWSMQPLTKLEDDIETSLLEGEEPDGLALIDLYCNYREQYFEVVDSYMRGRECPYGEYDDALKLTLKVASELFAEIFESETDVSERLRQTAQALFGAAQGLIEFQAQYAKSLQVEMPSEQEMYKMLHDTLCNKSSDQITTEISNFYYFMHESNIYPMLASRDRE